MSAAGNVRGRIADMLADVSRGPVKRWHVIDPTRKGLMMFFPGDKANTQDQAEAFAKKSMGDMWRDRFVVEGVR